VRCDNFAFHLVRTDCADSVNIRRTSSASHNGLMWFKHTAIVAAGLYAFFHDS
jgi:hypothetical protein